MVQSIELLFDEGTEAALRGAWHVLDAAGLPSLATHKGATNRPHVTVAVADDGLEHAVDAVRAVLQDRGFPAQGLPATVGGALLFGGHRRRFVLARAVVLSRRLQALHADVHRAVHHLAADADVVANSRPDAWTPHVTLARRIEAGQVGAALSLLDLEPLEVRFEAARLWDSGPRTVTALG